MGPHIRAVQGHIDRDVSDYADAQPVDIILQLFPLLIKLKLQKLPVANLLPQKFLIPFYSLRFSEPDGLLPFHPLFIAEMAFQSHVEGIIVQPVTVFSTECPVLLCLPVTASLIGFFQQRKAVIIDRVIFDLLLAVQPVAGVNLLLRQKLFLKKRVQINEVRISCKGRKRLIRAVPIAGGSQGQHLPVALSCPFQTVCKFIGALSKGADSIWSRKAGNGHKDARAPLQHCCHM